MEFTTDQDGKELLLKEGKFQVMMEWEKPYMHACIDALKPFGDVLEIGFGLGYSADHIQTYSIQSHTIIECDPIVAEKAREWAKSKPNVQIIEDTWQKTLPSLGAYDTVFFDDYPLETQGEVDDARAQIADTTQELKAIEDEVAEFRPKAYTDADIQELLDSIQPAEHLTSEFFQSFFENLLNEKQITPTQHAHILETLKNRGILLKKPLEHRGPGDRLLLFLKPVLKNHLKSGGRFSCYLERTESLYQDKGFRDLVINDPFLDFHETTIAVEVSPHCNYFDADKAFVITIQKS